MMGGDLNKITDEFRKAADIEAETPITAGVSMEMQLAARDATIAARDAEIERLTKQIEFRDERIDEMQSLLHDGRNMIADLTAKLAAATAFELPGVRFHRDARLSWWYAIRSSNGHMTRSFNSLDELTSHCIELGWLQHQAAIAAGWLGNGG